MVRNLGKRAEYDMKALCELYKVDPLDVMVKKGKSTLNRPTYIGVKDTNVKMLKRMQMYMGRIMDKLF